MKNYVKPSMKKVALISEKVLANPCWSLADNNGSEKFYFDHNGRDDGFYHFEVRKGNCGNNDNGRYLYYHSDRNDDKGTLVDFTGEHGANFDAFINQAQIGGAHPSFGNGYPHGYDVVKDSW